MNVFIETSIVNNVIDLEKRRPNDTTGQENFKYLTHFTCISKSIMGGI